ncbi:MAG: protein phosphatase CheZ [Syntrophobacteraceae bacterium]|jgi:chemotaxis protein CheZ|nr:protein phosphatase CheZ [Syntrophobacteraceae bacterium]
MMMAEKGDFEELAGLLSNIQSTVSSLRVENGRPEQITECRQLILSFHTTASMLGLDGLAQMGQDLEAFLGKWSPGNGGDRTLLSLGEHLGELSGHLAVAEDVSSMGELVDSVIMMIQAGCGSNGGGVAETEPRESPALPNLQRLERIVEGLGGRLTCAVDDVGGGQIALRFDALPGVVEKIETLLSPWDPDPGARLAPNLDHVDPKMRKIMESIKEFMKALSEGLLDKSQEILLDLSEQNSKSDLYKEIGSLARQLHSALKDVAATFDPGLKEMVELRIPDSGNRLEHILELTERAANVTMDNVELIQKRNQEAEASLATIREALTGLSALGTPARERLDTGLEMIDGVMTVFGQNRETLVNILTAQDFQDLTGQIIQKILNLLKELEMRLVQVVRAFGGHGAARKAEPEDELYGPAHKGKEEALHSQVDVDSLLAEFGF